MFPRVDELRARLQKAYPTLSKVSENPKKLSVKSVSVEPGLVRSAITSNEIANMLQQSSRHKKIQDVDYGPLPKRPSPIRLKVQEYEAETSLDCFMKHIATKSFEKYITEKTPGFRKSAITEICLPERKKKLKKLQREKKMNYGNLELFGQVEVRNRTPKAQERNLRLIEQDIKQNIKHWCIQEKNKINVEFQLIDHYTFKHKHK